MYRICSTRQGGLVFYSTSPFFQIKSVNLLLTNSLENELMIKDPMGSSISQS